VHRPLYAKRTASRGCVYSDFNFLIVTMASLRRCQDCVNFSLCSKPVLEIMPRSKPARLGEHIGRPRSTPWARLKRSISCLWTTTRHGC
jgi:hypothetical protein